MIVTQNTSTALSKKTREATTQALKRETEAALVLKTHLVELGVYGDDHEAVHDAIEGETNLFEALSDAVLRTGEDEAWIETLKAHEKQIKERRERLEGRVDAVYAAIGVAMATAEEKSFETPFGTVSEKDAPKKVTVTDESTIPSIYWKEQDPVLDKKLLYTDLKAGKTIPGAILSNDGKKIISITRK